MGNNPAHFTTAKHARHVDIDGQELEMCPNKPVECVSYNDIMKFIERLNEQDDAYNYSLPSLAEYLAITSLGKQRATTSCLNKELTCHVEFSDYITIGKKRLYALTSNVREFTSDSLQGDLPGTNHLLFGSFYGSTDNKSYKLSSLTRPFYYAETYSRDIGFRLIRHKNTEGEQPSKQYKIQWTKEEIENDIFYSWQENAKLHMHNIDGLQWMFDHKDLYSELARHTIGVLLDKAQTQAPTVLPSVYLTDLTTLSLSWNDIIDVGPLVSLPNLTELKLDINQIIDVSPLSVLTNLTRLDLYGNKIVDVGPLAALTNLTILRLSMNQILDVGSLAALTKLSGLLLRENPIIDWSPIEGLKRNGCYVDVVR